MKPSATPTGIRQSRNGWQAFVKVNGRFKSKSFPKDTPLMVMRRWREDQRAAPRLGVELPGEAQPIERDVDDYLASVETMRSFGDRRRHMLDWAKRFQGRQRNTIQPLEIRRELDRLHKTHEAQSCNNRRTALMSFYTALNGRSGYNPVRDVPKFRRDDDAPRDQPMFVIDWLLAFMRPSKTKARLVVMRWTGWPHMQVAQYRPQHRRGLGVYVTSRRKGGGVKGRVLPLLPGAMKALDDLEAQRAIGSFSRSAMHSAVARAVAQLNQVRVRLRLEPVSIRPYDFRHSFGTMLAQLTTDDRAIQEIMLHSTAAQTRRYTEAATAARVALAVEQVGLRLRQSVR